jgi:hypothetical protein
MKEADGEFDGDMMILDHTISHSVGPNWSSTYELILESRRIFDPTNNTVKGMLIDCEKQEKWHCEIPEQIQGRGPKVDAFGRGFGVISLGRSCSLSRNALGCLALCTCPGCATSPASANN